MAESHVDIDVIRKVLGGFKADTDPRLDRPLREQIAAVLAFAAADRLTPRRSIPVTWDDTDIVICNVVCKLVDEVARLTEVLESIAYEGGDCLAVEGGSASRPCRVCAVCTAREALCGEVA